MNYYEILDIKSTASAAEIKQAYRRLAKKFHPDSQNNDANHEQIVRINQAYEVLSDSQNRRIYDQKLAVNYSSYREKNNGTASSYYRRNRQQQQQEDTTQFQWFTEVYLPVSHLITNILSPLDREIEELSADPFDDDLMLTFTDYLGDCHSSFEQARLVLTSQPNPRKYASVAANLYYCLNHISDGIEELQRFCQNYDDYYLHTGRELFKLASKINLEAVTIADQLT